MQRPVALALALFAVGLVPVAARADAPFSFDATPGKLPKTVIPLDYDITLHTHVATFTFDGNEAVAIRVTAPTSSVVFNTLGLTVTRATLDGKPAASIKTDDHTQLTTLALATPAGRGTHALQLAFAGKIGDQPQGLFYQKFAAPGGERVMLATQMESTDARRMFPSWDEPAFRATYRLRVSVPKAFDAVSNMPAVTQTVAGDLKTVTFARTPKMATYLVVLCAGEFGYVSGEADGIKVRVVAPKGREENGRYALDAAEKLLTYYDAYFGTKYPLPKLDLIAVPGGFPGAMENWGGITFTQDDLLFDPTVEPDSAKQGVFETIAHEMSHQWFGDLVTMAWWDGLWLNEGFADWMQTKASDHFNPQWHLWQRVNGDVEAAMRTDGQTTTHPVQTAIADETQADAAFDEITYQKGGAFIRMTEEYLGEDTFRDGIRAYIRANAYSNTTSANLYAALSTASHQDIAAFATAWTTAPGFPLVSVTESCAGGHTNLAVTQQRFFYEPNQTSEQTWQIPLSVAPALDTQSAHTTLLAARSANLDGGPCNGPVLANAGAAGYFRVQYDPTTNAALVASLEKLTPVDRVRVIADTQALVIAQKLPADAFLQLVAHLGTDDNLAVWDQTLGGFGAITNYEIGRPGEAAFDAYRRSVLRPVFDRIGGWTATPGDPTASSLRRRLIETLGDAGDADVIAQSRARYAQFKEHPDSLPPDLRGSVLNVVGTYADAAVWNDMHARMKAAKTTEEAMLYVTAMCHARDAQLAQKDLDMALSGDLPAEAGPIAALLNIVTIAQNGRHPALTWNFYRSNTAVLTAHLSEFERVAIGSRILPLFWNAAPLPELEAYAKANLPANAPSTAQAVKLIELAVATADRIVPIVDAWIATKNPPITAGRSSR